MTTEAFGEISLPLFEDRPIGSAELTAGARVTNYRAERDDGVSDKDNGNWTYKIGGSWEPIPDIKFRAMYSKAVRAPNLAELFQPQVVALSNLISTVLTALTLAQEITNPAGGAFTGETATTLAVAEKFHQLRVRFLPFVVKSLHGVHCEGPHVIVRPCIGPINRTSRGERSQALS